MNENLTQHFTFIFSLKLLTKESKQKYFEENQNKKYIENSLLYKTDVLDEKLKKGGKTEKNLYFMVI